MSIDRSLKIKGALTRHRNVLSRAERIEKLKDEERWSEEDSVFGLQKVAHRKSHAGKKIKEEAAAVEGAAAAVTPEGQAPAGAKAATPAAGAKAAAPAKAAGAKPAAAGAAPAKEKAAEKSKGKEKSK
ncbi:MAG: small basic protein [Sedimentisphaerales bacterium]|nr:small basic protein [Sedimentisphaerales bacterium]